MFSSETDQFTLDSRDTVHGYVVLECSYVLSYVIKWIFLFVCALDGISKSVTYHLKRIM